MDTNLMDSYKNWKDFIFKILTKENQFILEKSFRKGSTESEIYRQLIENTETTLEFIYLEDGRLICFNIFNPETPGFNKSQIDYFDENDFKLNKTYGKPGLEFLQVNMDGIYGNLLRGIKGKEVLFYAGNKLSHSNVTRAYEPKFSETSWHYFEKSSSWEKLKKLFSVKEIIYETREIDLNKIFSGIK